MNIQNLIRTLNPAKITPELRAMIAAHMEQDAKQSERDKGRKPGAAPATPLQHNVISQDRLAIISNRVAMMMRDAVPRTAKQVASACGISTADARVVMADLLVNNVVYRTNPAARGLSVEYRHHMAARILNGRDRFDPKARKSRLRNIEASGGMAALSAEK